MVDGCGWSGGAVLVIDQPPTLAQDRDEDHGVPRGSVVPHHFHLCGAPSPGVEPRAHPARRVLAAADQIAVLVRGPQALAQPRRDWAVSQPPLQCVAGGIVVSGSGKRSNQNGDGLDRGSSHGGMPTRRPAARSGQRQCSKYSRKENRSCEKLEHASHLTDANKRTICRARFTFRLITFKNLSDADTAEVPSAHHVLAICVIECSLSSVASVVTSCVQP